MFNFLGFNTTQFNSLPYYLRAFKERAELRPRMKAVLSYIPSMLDACVDKPLGIR